MSWKVLLPFRAGNQGQRDDQVTIGRKGSGEIVVRLGVDVLNHIEAKIGEPMQVEMGKGEHAGLVRLSRGPGYRLRAAHKASTHGDIVFKSELSEPSRRLQIIVTYTLEDGAIVARLPAWVSNKAEAAAPRPATPPPPPGKRRRRARRHQAYPVLRGTGRTEPGRHRLEAR